MMLENFDFAEGNSSTNTGMYYISAKKDDLSQWPQLISAQGCHFMEKVDPVEYYSPLTMTGIVLAATIGAVAMIYKFSKRDKIFERTFNERERRMNNSSQ